MSILLPKLVGEITIKQRKPRYHGEAVYKTLSFVRPKPKKTEHVEIIRYVPSGHGNFREEPYWHQFNVEQQFQRHGRTAPVIETVPAPYQIGYGHQHHLIEPKPEPEYKLIAPKSKSKSKSKKSETGYTIFDESDTESSHSGSSRTSSFGSSKSTKSSRSTSSSSSRSSGKSGFGPVVGW